MTNFQTVGQATPVLLVQTDQGVPGRAQFSSDREYVKFLRKMLKDASKKKEDDKKKDEKKPKTFTYWELLSLLMLFSVPLATVEILIGYSMFRTIRMLATGQ